jgi:hypothetical protein
VLHVWGAWAVVAGLVQLIVGVTRRKMGGQWPMIASGGISVLAGASFIVGASADNLTLTNAARGRGRRDTDRRRRLRPGRRRRIRPARRRILGHARMVVDEDR